jgi:hypothetical protein
MMQKFPPSADAVPEPLREHVRKVDSLTLRLIGMLNGSGETNPSVVLDVVLNVYLNAASSYGRQIECARHLVQIGGQILLEDTMQQRAAGVDAPGSPTRH